MKKNFFGFIFLLFFVLITPGKSSAYSSDPKQFISNIVDEAKKILVATNSKEFKTKKLSEMALKVVDIKGIGFYSLGSYRKDLSDEQLKEYMMLFEKYFLKSFTSRLSAYSDPKIDVLQADVINPKYTMVKSLLQGTDKKPEVKINWRVYTKNPENPLIRDLIIEGLSLAKTQKEEFASVIESNNGDITKLFITLKQFVDK
ncbi:MAG TPA: ABC transporter substrate-binding protein [Candidatus Pelagibacter sp.]|jgi:phospholipid transport system substrate-binding protein|nr:ABC transporter substrate-binding protein [Candidatus Pelagibacter sp.]